MFPKGTDFTRITSRVSGQWLFIIAGWICPWLRLEHIMRSDQSTCKGRVLPLSRWLWLCWYRSLSGGLVGESGGLSQNGGISLSQLISSPWSWWLSVYGSAITDYLYHVNASTVTVICVYWIYFIDACVMWNCFGFAFICRTLFQECIYISVGSTFTGSPHGSYYEIPWFFPDI